MSQSLKRRAFVKQVVVASSATALVGATHSATATTVTPEKQKPVKQQGYHVTEHIKAYYKTAAF